MLGTTHEAAATLRGIDEQIFNHRFLELRNQLTHSLAPILEWRSLIWFEVGVIVDGGVIGYEGKHLTPAERIQGLDTPPEELFSRSVADGREVIALLVTAIERLAELLTATGRLEPPPVLLGVRRDVLEHRPYELPADYSRRERLLQVGDRAKVPCRRGEDRRPDHVPVVLALIALHRQREPGLEQGA